MTDPKSSSGAHDTDAIRHQYPVIDRLSSTDAGYKPRLLDTITWLFYDLKSDYMRVKCR